ncbi:MAG: CHASE2 domain-containing protein [Leptothrix sp. (in: Bacteria)]|nr:CHASE2 domain-containing protein [Leptothrix sp. (in: b-proteobacteria)]
MSFWRASWWTRERCSCLGSLLLLLSVWLFTDLSGGVERAAYDHASARAGRPGSSDVLVVAIDAQSLASQGAWPWPRELHARLIDRLHAAGAKVVVHTEAFVGAESPRALAELHRIARTVASDPDLARHPQLPMVLSESQELLDGDARLAQSLSAHGHSLLLTGTMQAPAVAVESLLAQAPTAAGARGVSSRVGAARTLDWPPAVLATAARALGHLEFVPDTDGLLRRHAVWAGSPDSPVLSLALQSASLQLGVDPAQLRQQGRAALPLKVGERAVPVDALGQLWPLYARPRAGQPAFASLSAEAVLAGRFKPAAVGGKLVWVGRTDTAVAAPLLHWDTPGLRELAPVELAAQVSSAVLTGQLVSTPAWAQGLPWLLLLPVAAYLLLGAPRLAPAAAAAVGLLLALSLLLVSELMLSSTRVWMPLGLPAAAVATGTVGLLLSRRWPEGGLRVLSGLALGGPAPFAGAALSAPVQAGKPATTALAAAPGSAPVAAPVAAPVPDLVSGDGPGGAAGPSEFDDRAGWSVAATLVPSPEATSDAASPEQALVHLADAFRGMAVAPLEATLPLQVSALPPKAAAAEAGQGGGERLPRLGRYLLRSEIGRGTMGRVYLGVEIGQDTELAIKTLALAREFEGFALRDARARFQREAVAASRLQHPDIVRVLDVGEHNGLAYLVMERVMGEDLTHHVHRRHRLSMRSVVALGARVAAALAHAHGQGVIHRDIKPANIMLDLAGGKVKVTDFGIAHISDAARTRTGLVLGSPSYMSPEQLQGRAVDGRSDLYSLGVVLFQLLTGELPLKGATLADLIDAVTRQPAPDVRSLASEVPESLATLLSILLQKRPELRYPDGRQLAADLRLVGAALNAGRSRARVPDPSRQESAPAAPVAPRRG